MLYKKGNILFGTQKTVCEIFNIYTGNVQKLTLNIISEQASY